MLLVAVAVDALDGPLVLLRGVELIARVPSAARSDLRDLAGQEGASVRVNWSGDLEIAAWGVSMGAEQEWGLSCEGYVQRRDTMVTSALLVGPELAEDPYAAGPVIHWLDVRERESNDGSWPVMADCDRPRWEWTPLEHVGPLRFGMSPQQVAAALDHGVPDGREGYFPPWWHMKAEPWTLSTDRFKAAGVSAHYWYPDGIPVLGAVSVHGRTGPQVAFEDIDLIGKTVSALDTALTEWAENNGMALAMGCSGDLGPHGMNMYIRAARAGDGVVSGARSCAADWEDHG
uniref:Uncharacterized protein n=1 Tax=Streptomyces sp. NBC_00003 TaxID=2903608 RepID=A0AAU2VFV7_9ACTN